MTAVAQAEKLSIDITQEMHVRSSLAATFAALVEELGPSNVGLENQPMPMVLELWPGGRWFRDLGDGNGHFWGHVQAVKKPTLLEICGPLMMSFAVTSNLQYRLSEVKGGTLITLRHQVLGPIPEAYREGLGEGWSQLFDKVKARAERA
jgi:hypothetical protein